MPTQQTQQGLYWGAQPRCVICRSQNCRPRLCAAAAAVHVDLPQPGTAQGGARAELWPAQLPATPWNSGVPRPADGTSHNIRSYLEKKKKKPTHDIYLRYMKQIGFCILIKFMLFYEATITTLHERAPKPKQIYELYLQTQSFMPREACKIEDEQLS